jgi:hypothetical protein
MELEGQWDLVEEEVSDVFATLLDDVKSLLETFKSTLQGEFCILELSETGRSA